jgi:hypothetical protein
MLEYIDIVDVVQVLLQNVRVFGVFLAVEQPQFRLSLHETKSVRDWFRTFYILLLKHVEILYFTV